MKTMTVSEVVALCPCGVEDNQTTLGWHIQQFCNALGQVSAVDILLFGPEHGISCSEMLWFVLRPELIEPDVAARFAVLCAEHVERYGDAAHSEVTQKCNAVTRRFLAGKATVEELEEVAEAARGDWAAIAAAKAAKAVKAAQLAGSAWAAAGAARDAAEYAVTAARDAEAEWQCKTLLGLLKDDKSKNVLFHLHRKISEGLRGLYEANRAEVEVGP